MIFPIGHENLRGRRWPWVTTIIIVLNTVVFLATNGTMQRQLAQTGQTELHILLLSAAYPDAPMTPEASEIVQAYKLEHADAYAEMADPDRTQFVDTWDENLHLRAYSEGYADAEMKHLCQQLATTQANSIAWNYAFHSVHPFARTYITSMFLHGGWLHLIFNMWFLWLAGTILEDLWGRIVYPIFYLAAGVLACAVQGAMFPHSFAPALGASGAIAGLMGAFLTRFPTTRIRLGWLLWIQIVWFYVPAYVILPLWMGLQVLWGVMARAAAVDTGVGYWAHIGGFAFGALGAYLLRATGVEHTVDSAIESKVSWTADPVIVRASESLAENKAEDAVAALQQLVKEKPDSLDAWDLLLKAQQRKQDFQGQKQTLAVLCRLHVVAGDLEAGATDYELYQNVGGDGLPRGVWAELCRYYEREQRWELAVEEYAKLAEANSTARAGVSALISAGNICITNLHSPERAEKFFKAAEASSAPHSDLDAAIQEGLKKCAAAAPQPGRYSH